MQALVEAAEQLCERAILHFANEDRPGGLYASLRFCLPQHSEELDRLSAGHGEIAVAIWEVCRKAREPGARHEDLRKQGSRLVRMLRTHEKREHEMVRETLSALDRNSFARAEEELYDEHLWLHRYEDVLESARNAKDLRSAAEELRRALTLHFAHEEHPGGLYDSLQFCAPSHKKELADLVQAHQDITYSVWQLCQHAQDPSAELQVLRSEAAELIHKLQYHERAENAMARYALLPIDQGSFARAVEELRNEHHRLQEIAEALKTAQYQPALYAAAQDLRNALITHFAHEEHPGGLYDALKFYVPQHGKERDMLLEMHQDIILSCWQLCQRAREPNAKVQSLRKEAQGVIKKVQRHEVREHALVRSIRASVPRRTGQRV